jgi:copper homeostasis protein
MLLVEICVEDSAGALVAERAGAHRIELCCNLPEGGLTPSYGSIYRTRQTTGLPIHVLIRPRPGHFRYSTDEHKVMLTDIEACKTLGVQGVVLGALDSEDNLDLNQTGQLIEAARPLSVTFHRAFDLCRSPEETLEQLIALRADHILTSGAQPSAIQGIPLLRKLQAKAAGRIGILACGNIRAHNVRQVLEETGVGEIHLSAQQSQPQPTSPIGLGKVRQTSGALIQEVIAAASRQ